MAEEVRVRARFLADAGSEPVCATGSRWGRYITITGSYLRYYRKSEDYEQGMPSRKKPVNLFGARVTVPPDKPSCLDVVRPSGGGRALDVANHMICSDWIVAGTRRGPGEDAALPRVRGGHG